MTQNTDDLFERNLQALNRFHPGMYQQMVAIKEPAAQVVGSLQTSDLNIDLGHTLLYPVDAQAHADRQLAEYLANPTRFYMNPPLHHQGPEKPYHHDHISSALWEFAKGTGMPGLPKLPSAEAGFLIIYGIGLGLHLPRLFDEIDVRHFILAEEFIEFMYHTLRLIDWEAIFAKFEERGQTIQFVFGRDPAQVAQRVHWSMRGKQFGLLDGSYLFRHYSSMMLDKAHEEFKEKLPLLPISIGFVEDEWTMLEHCGINLLKIDFKLLDDRPRLEKNLPAFIVGSGPSIDNSIEAIKRLQGQAIIFSCGTGLQPLLRNGIRPDFHCELENGYASYDHLKRTADQFDLDGITLIASTTVIPYMPLLFKKNVLYFRDSVSSTGIWAPDRIGLYGTAPTCTNLAIRAALLLCFRQIYLFGVDLGTRDASKHHSHDAIYYRADDWGRTYTATQDSMGIEMPANFGGKAYTNAVLHWTRMMMAQGLEMFSTYAKIYNCSDGVQIPGTLPKLSRTLKLDAPLHRKPILLQRLEAELVHKNAGEMATVEGLHIAEARAKKMSFIEFYERCAPMVSELGENRYQRALRSVHVGTIMICFQMGYFFNRRVAPELRPAMMLAFLDALDERLEVIQGQFEERLGRVLSWVDKDLTLPA
jgi:hypothetical protein